MREETVKISTEYIKLEGLLKFAGTAERPNSASRPVR